MSDFIKKNGISWKTRCFKIWMSTSCVQAIMQSVYELTTDWMCISYLKIPKFVDKTQTKFPEFKLEIFWKKFQEDIVERKDKQHVSLGKKFDVSLKNKEDIWLVCKPLFLCGSLAGSDKCLWIFVGNWQFVCWSLAGK